MPFYKRENDELLVAPNFVRGPGFDLFAEQKDEYQYPVEGWYWFDNLDAAVAAFAPKPAGVSPRQIRQAMTRTTVGSGTLREAVEQAVLAGDQDIKDWSNYSTLFERDNPQVAVMAQAIGVSGAHVDALWQLAATL